MYDIPGKGHKMTSHLRTLSSEEDFTDKTTTSLLVTTELGIIKKFEQSILRSCLRH